MKKLSRFMLPLFCVTCIVAVLLYHFPPQAYGVAAIVPLFALGGYCAWHDYQALGALRLEEHQQRRSELFSEAIAASNAVISAIELTSLPELILDKCQGLFRGPTRSAFFEIEPGAVSDMIRPGLQKGFDPEVIGRFSFPLDKGTGALGRAIVRNEILVINDSETRFWCNQEFLAANGLEQFLVIPFRLQEIPLGALLVDYPEDLPRSFVVEALTPLKDQIPIALENRRLYHHVEEISIHDEMTGLYNYRFFRARLKEELERAKRYGHQLSLVLLDIDHFKQFNDEFGHQIGDEALRTVARALEAHTRAVAVVARYGGEEFVIVEPEAEKAEIRRGAERVREEISRLEVLTDAGEPTRPLRISAGIAAFPDDADTEDALIQQADAALLYSKQAGRNRVTIAPAPTSGPAGEEP